MSASNGRVESRERGAEAYYRGVGYNAFIGEAVPGRVSGPLLSQCTAAAAC
jgi:hypothetical protein